MVECRYWTPLQIRWRSLIITRKLITVILGALTQYEVPPFMLTFVLLLCSDTLKTSVRSNVQSSYCTNVHSIDPSRASTGISQIRKDVDQSRGEMEPLTTVRIITVLNMTKPQEFARTATSELFKRSKLESVYTACA